MKIYNLKDPLRGSHQMVHALLIFIMTAIAWPFLQGLIMTPNGTEGYIDRSVFLLILLAFLSFLGFVIIVWWLLQRFWVLAGFPAIASLVSQFKTLELWQQLGFYWASFALLLLAGVGTLSAMI